MLTSQVLAIDLQATVDSCGFQNCLIHGHLSDSAQDWSEWSDTCYNPLVDQPGPKTLLSFKTIDCCLPSFVVAVGRFVAALC